ncbi:hypothetical protein STRCR_0101 [Streptococcus criceti HS-6]|uniref:Uncharacterized protein n=1 Tax=Streptococcus criceti HS-6 TaxID=873449 RepID=G5JMY5_STRCG|nr:hypothetical protein STRCR_0101 [Streptococcus criceti HS-6]
MTSKFNQFFLIKFIIFLFYRASELMELLKSRSALVASLEMG